LFSRFLIIPKFLLFETNAYDFLFFLLFNFLVKPCSKICVRCQKQFWKPLVKFNKGFNVLPFPIFKKIMNYNDNFVYFRSLHQCWAFFYLYEPSFLFLEKIGMVPIPHISFKFCLSKKKFFAFNSKNQI